MKNNLEVYKSIDKNFLINFIEKNVTENNKEIIDMIKTSILIDKEVLLRTIFDKLNRDSIILSVNKMDNNKGFDILCMTITDSIEFSKTSVFASAFLNYRNELNRKKIEIEKSYPKKEYLMINNQMNIYLNEIDSALKSLSIENLLNSY